MELFPNFYSLGWILREEGYTTAAAAMSCAYSPEEAREMTRTYWQLNAIGDGLAVEENA